MSTTEDRYTDAKQIAEVAQDLLGGRGVDDIASAQWPSLDEEQFTMAKALANHVHKAQYDRGFTNGAGIECISILLGLELLSLHANGAKIETRQTMVREPSSPRLCCTPAS